MCALVLIWLVTSEYEYTEVNAGVNAFGKITWFLVNGARTSLN